MYIFKSQEPRWCSSNCLRLVIGHSTAFSWPKQCVMVLDHMIQDHSLGQNFTVATLGSQNLARM